MPGKTQGDLIRELQVFAATFTERVDNLREEVKRSDLALRDVVPRLQVVEEQVANVRTTLDEKGRRWWSIVPAIIGAIIGSGLTLLGQLILHALRKP